MSVQTRTSDQGCLDIPVPIVSLNRWTLLVGIVAGFILQQPLFTTALFLILLPAVLYGQRRSLIFQTGKRLLAKQIQSAEYEDRRLMRFNNSIALILLGAAQIAFLLHATIAGWVLAGMVAVAASVALAGFCFGCYLYYHFRMQRYRLFS